MQVKADVMEKPGKISVQEFPYPEELQSDSMIIKSEIAGVCGTDKHFYDGKAPWLKFPIIPGHEIVGSVHDVGEKAATNSEANGQILKKGDVVTLIPGIRCGKCWYCRFVPQRAGALCTDIRGVYGIMSCKAPPHLFGGWAQYVYVLPGSWVYKVPANLPMEVAVLVEPLAATNGIGRAMSKYPQMKEGFGPMDTVVIQGSGPIGILAAFRARVYGAGNIIVLGAPERRLRLAEKFGAEHTINIEEVPDKEERIRRVMALTNNRGADLVVECAGAPSAFVEGIELTRRGGTLVEMGHFTSVGTVPLDPWRIVHKDLTIIGTIGYAPTQFDRDLKLLSRYLNEFPLKEIVTDKFRLEEAERAIQAVRRMEAVKAVILP